MTNEGHFPTSAPSIRVFTQTPLKYLLSLLKQTQRAALMSIAPFREEWIELCKHHELKSSECWTPLKVRNLALSLVDIKIKMRERGETKCSHCDSAINTIIPIKVEKALCKDEQVALGMHRALKWTNQYELGTGILLMSCSLAELVCLFFVSPPPHTQRYKRHVNRWRCLRCKSQHSFSCSTPQI